MRPLRHRRHLWLFFGAMFVTCAAFVSLGVVAIVQDAQLGEQRRAAARGRAVEQVQRELLAALDRIKFEALVGNRAPQAAAYVLTASIENSAPVLPWDRRHGHAPETRAEFAQHVEAGERAELAGKNLTEALASYAAALGVATTPAERGTAGLLQARVLSKLGRQPPMEAALQRVLMLPDEVVDEEGVPLKLYAAERLVRSGPARPEAASAIAAATARAAVLSPAALHLIAAALGTPPEAVRARLELIEHAEALRRDFAGLGVTANTWVLHRPSGWLVSASPPGSPPAIVAVSAARLVDAVRRAWNAKIWGPASIALAENGEALGNELAGLRVRLALEDVPGGAPRSFFFLSLILAVLATMCGSWLVWRDLQREVRTAEIRAQFVSSVSHELKTPLTAIRMFAETLQLGRSQDPDTRSEYLETIVNECERLTRLVDDVLTFSRIERGQKKYRFASTRLEDVVRSAARAMRYPVATQGFELRLEVQPDLPPIQADADALEQAVLNLLSNAMKYSGDSRTIPLSLRCEDAEAVIRVTDYGVGIAAGEQNRIFDKFYRARTRENEVISGTGIGLSIVLNAARAHGGRVHVESQPGRGSTFEIRIPLREGT